MSFFFFHNVQFNNLSLIQIKMMLLVGTICPNNTEILLNKGHNLAHSTNSSLPRTLGYNKYFLYFSNNLTTNMASNRSVMKMTAISHWKSS